MHYVARVDVISQNRPRCADGPAGRKGQRALECGCARAGNIEAGDGAVRSAHEAVKYVTRILGSSRDGPLRVDAFRKGALEGARARARARDVECGDSAVRGAHEAVKYVVCVKVPSGNRTSR